jgi:hypothetical protein
MTAAQQVNQPQPRKAIAGTGAGRVNGLACGQQHGRIDRDRRGTIGVVPATEDGERHAAPLRLGDHGGPDRERRRVAIAGREPRGDGEPTEELGPLDGGEQRLRRGVGARGIGKVFRRKDAVDARGECTGGTHRVTDAATLAAIHGAHAGLGHRGGELHRACALGRAPGQGLAERQADVFDGHARLGDRTGQLRQHGRRVAAYPWGMNRTVFAASLAWCAWCLACAAPTLVAITAFLVLKRMGAVDPEAGTWFADDPAASGSFVAGQVAGTAFRTMAWAKLVLAPVALVLLAKAMLCRPRWAIAMLVLAGVTTAASHALDTRTASVGDAWHGAVHAGNREGAASSKASMDALHPWAERLNGSASLTAILAGAVALAHAAPRRAGA